MSERERPVINAMLRTVLLMIQDAEAISRTGNTWEKIYDDAKARLYGELDLVAQYPTPDRPPEPETAEQKRLRIKDRMLRWMVTQPGTDMHLLIKAIEGVYVTTSPTEHTFEDYENLWTEYLALFQHLDAIRAALGMAPYPKGSLNAGEVYTEVAALVARCKALQVAVIPTPRPSDGRPWGPDFNGLVYMVNSLLVKM